MKSELIVSFLSRAKANTVVRGSEKGHKLRRWRWNSANVSTRGGRRVRRQRCSESLLRRQRRALLAEAVRALKDHATKPALLKKSLNLVRLLPSALNSFISSGKRPNLFEFTTL